MILPAIRHCAEGTLTTSGPRPLHVAIIISSLDMSPGGLETMARGLARGLAEREHRAIEAAQLLNKMFSNMGQA